MENEIRHILIIGFVWPEPDSSAAGTRMMQLIRWFHAQKWEVTFASAAAKGSHMADLESLGIKTVSIRVNDSAFDDFIRDLKPDMVLFDRFITEEQFGWRVAEQCPEALRVLDTEDLHCLRKTRKKAVKANKEFRSSDLLNEKVTKREVASILRSDLSLIISKAEIELLQDLFDINSELLHYLPFMVGLIDKRGRRVRPSFEERRHFMTIGNFSHPPNMDSVLYLKETVWPCVRKRLPGAELHVYGAYPTRKVAQLHDSEQGFVIAGRAKNAFDVIGKAGVMLAPLRFGAGLKGKLLESMQCGTPSVTTPIGAEGMAGDLPWSGVIAEEPGALADAAVMLHEDREKWYEAVDRGRTIVNAQFNGEHHGQKFIERLLQCYGNLEAHRRGNFIGSILRHQTMASTKYMSRWIEEKNKP